MPNVVLFKSESDGSDKFVQVLENSHFAIRSIGCLDFQFKNLQELNERLERADDYEGLIFTSPRAVSVVEKAAAMSLDAWCNKRNYSIGESTGGLVRELLKLESRGQQAGNAQNLADIIIQDGPASKPFLFPSGNLKQDILEKTLNEKSIQVTAIEAYETVPHPELAAAIESLKNERINFIVFFSPSGIKFTLPIITAAQLELSNIKLIAIGPSTKRAMDENNLKCHRVCTKPSPESLLEALTDGN